MKIPSVKQKQKNSNLYMLNEDDGAKKKKIMIGGAVLIVIFALSILLAGGGPKPGQTQLKEALVDMNDSLGIINYYENDLQYAPSENNVSLAKVLLRGNFQKLNDLYNKTYKPKKKIANATKPDSDSGDKLDASLRNNTLDADIIDVLNQKTIDAQAALRRAQPSFTGPQSKQDIKDTLSDLSSLEDTLTHAQ